MEANTCNFSYLDEDALLPPRKRLLAGLKRQSSDINSPASSTPSSGMSENDAHLDNLLSSRLNNPNLSYEEIVEASRFAAIEARKVAVSARANAEDKAEKAAKAVAAAKSALEFVASLAANKEKSLKKIKKHAPVEELYSKNKRKTNCRTDEEVALNLHRVINSFPRAVKSLKIMSNGVVGDIDLEGPIKTIDLNISNSKQDKGGRLRLNKGAGHCKTDQLNVENFSESFDSFGKKRGKFKQKELPLSICSFKVNPN